MKNAISKRQLLVSISDVALSLLAWFSAYWLRFNFSIPAEYANAMILAMPIVFFVQVILFWVTGVQAAFWRFTGLIDLRKLIVSIFLSTSLISLVLFFLGRGIHVPRSVLILYALNFCVFACLVRVGYRYLKERQFFVFEKTARKPVLVLGAGVAGEMLVRQLQGSSSWYVAGFLDDDLAKRGGNIHGVKVLGILGDLKKVANSLGIRQVIMALPSVSHEVRRKVAASCKSAGVETLTVPAIDDLVSGNVSVSEIRELELDDLLGRNPVHLDVEGLKSHLDGEIILVTGAGGSIGSELCRQLARFSPKLIILLENSEYALYLVETELRDNYPGLDCRPVIGDVRSESRVQETMSRYKPRIVFHAAAYKHVPLMENNNALEAVKNNVLGTINLAKASRSNGVESFVFISTDKAVNPTSVMGATKRLAEMVCESFQNLQSNSKTTRFVVTRFGNVIGSTGSVIPRFRQQIKLGGPLTVTHPDIKRFFMSISEAAQLVLQASIIDDSGAIYVLDMGKPIKIADVARELLRLSGKTEADIEIVYTGLRDGEKMSEELLADGEILTDTNHPKLKTAKCRPVDEELIFHIESDFVGLNIADDIEIKKKLRKLIPEYKPL